MSCKQTDADKKTSHAYIPLVSKSFGVLLGSSG